MKKFLFFLFVLMVQISHAQNDKSAQVIGVIISEADGSPLEGMNVSIPYLKVLTTTNASGVFDLLM